MFIEGIRFWILHFDSFFCCEILSSGLNCYPVQRKLHLDDAVRDVQARVMEG